MMAVRWTAGRVVVGVDTMAGFSLLAHGCADVQRPPFIPSGGAAAKKGVASDAHSYLSVGTEYGLLQKKRRQEEREARARFVAGRFKGVNQAEAARRVAVKSYLNSPDEEALELEKQWIREKTLLATADFARKRVGRTWWGKVESWLKHGSRTSFLSSQAPRLA